MTQFDLNCFSFISLQLTAAWAYKYILCNRLQWLPNSFEGFCSSYYATFLPYHPICHMSHCWLDNFSQTCLFWLTQIVAKFLFFLILSSLYICFKNNTKKKNLFVLFAVHVKRRWIGDSTTTNNTLINL